MTRLAFIQVFKKKRRTFLSLLAVSFSSAIIFTAMILFLNVIDFSTLSNYSDLGNYHYCFISDKDISYTTRYEVGIDQDTGLFIDGMNLRVYTNEWISPFRIIEGKMPEKEGEILVSKTSKYQLNDPIMNEFRVVGIYESSVNDTFAYTCLEGNGSKIYYVKDTMVHLSTSFGDVCEMFQISGNDITNNTEVIRMDTMAVYLGDSQMILSIFVFMVIMTMMMAYISIHNVILISDEERKKELGLLKSVGAKAKDVRYLLTLELFIISSFGALLGILFGLVLAYFILNLFISALYITFEWAMILKTNCMLLTWIISVLLMHLSGMKAYKKYIHSLPIDDLKDVGYQYATPVASKGLRKNDASWNLFLMYNGRMKDQTKNILQSFVLIIVTGILFVFVTMSNLAYKNQYYGKEYDFELSQISGSVNNEVMMEIYDLVENGDCEVTKLEVDRVSVFQLLTTPYMYLHETETLKQLYEKEGQQGFFIKEDGGSTTWTNPYHLVTWFDEKQMEILEPYIVDGSYGFLEVEDYDHVYPMKFIAVLVDTKIRGEGLTLCTNFQIRDRLGEWGLGADTIGLNKTDILGEQNKNKSPVSIGTIIEIPYEKIDEISEAIHIDLRIYPSIFAQSYNSAMNRGFSGNQFYRIKFRNSAMANLFESELSKILKEYEVLEEYVFTNVYATIETMNFTVFINEVLLNPLFAMMFLVALLNMYNVFSGNIQLKRKDISIMKSIGMKNKQVKTMLIFEYLEGYLNASFLISVVVVSLYVFFKPDQYDLGQLLASLVASVLFVAPLLIVPVVYFTIQKASSITPLENAKNIE